MEVTVELSWKAVSFLFSTIRKNKSMRSLNSLSSNLRSVEKLISVGVSPWEKCARPTLGYHDGGVDKKLFINVSNITPIV